MSEPYAFVAFSNICCHSDINGQGNGHDAGQVLCERWSLCVERMAATEKTRALTKKFNQPVPSRAHGVVVSHPLSMREALGSIPSESTFLFRTCYAPHPKKALRVTWQFVL